ncbi:restriction endonuclease subunit S [Streptomyces canus]|uniref:restriction endonuclease subunit S n=1 Tax=Streptomyces canus TaxID=58343 RepID=UPI00382F8D8F
MNADGRHDLPEGWRLAPLGELCDIQAGGAPLLKDLRAGEGIPVVRPADLRHQRITADTDDLVRADPRTSGGLLRLRLAPGDVLVVRSGTVGRAALVTDDEAGWLYNSHLFRLRPREAVQAPYLVGYFSRRWTETWLGRRAAGTTGMRSITVRTLADLPVVLPPLDRQQEIGAALSALDEKIRAHEEIVRATSALREAVADHLMSGRQPTRS